MTYITKNIYNKQSYKGWNKVKKRKCQMYISGWAVSSYTSLNYSNLNLTLEELSLTASSTEEHRGRFSSFRNSSLWFDAILGLKSMQRLKCLNLYTKLPNFDHPITTYPPGFENVTESRRIFNGEYCKELYKQGIDQLCQNLRPHLPHLTITTSFIHSLWFLNWENIQRKDNLT